MDEKAKVKMRFLNLYCMVMADGIVHPKEMETLYRIGTKTYGLTLEEITESVKSSGISSVIPELPEERISMLYEMALIAWADGEVENSERNLLRRYAIRYGIVEEYIDQLVDFLLEKAKNNIKVEDIVNELKN